ncbi:MAG TPA: hypothetical protein VIT64_14655 [Ilumatobacteraceae bacterium]
MSFVMRNRRFGIATRLIALGLLVAACSDDALDLTAQQPTTVAPEPSTTSEPLPTTSRPPRTTTTSSTVAPTTTAMATTTTLPVAPETAWALRYTGGVGAAATGEPVRIGYVNQDEFFPEATVGLDAAIAFVNAELGGAAGRPIEVVRCVVATVADGAKCGQQFADDASIVAVVTGTILFGNKDLYDVLNGRKPVLISNGVTTDDFTTPAGLTFSLGSVNVIPALALFATQHLDPAPASAALLYSDNTARRNAVEFLVQPVFASAGIPTTLVPVPDGIGAAELAQSMQAVGADTAELIVPVVTVQNCIAVYDAVQLLAIDPAVITTGLCSGPPMTAHLAALGLLDPVPDGWYFAGNGYNFFAPDEPSGMLTYVGKVRQYGPLGTGAAGAAPPTTTATLDPAAPIDPAAPAAPDYTGFSAPVFANVLTLAKFANALGPDALTSIGLEAQLRSFAGPMMLQAGDLQCGVEPYIAVCGHYAGVQQYRAGVWTAIADGTNGMAIDVRPA